MSAARRRATPPVSDPRARRAEATRFMRRALELSRQGMRAGDGGPFGAVVVEDGIIVGEGWNRVVGGNDPTAHGEIVAIRDAGRRLGRFSLEGCELYTSGEPCPMCLGAIYWARIARVYFGFTIADAARIGFDDQLIYREIAQPPRRRQIPQTQLLAKEARQVLRAYAADPERVRY